MLIQEKGVSISTSQPMYGEGIKLAVIENKQINKLKEQAMKTIN